MVDIPVTLAPTVIDTRNHWLEIVKLESFVHGGQGQVADLGLRLVVAYAFPSTQSVAAYATKMKLTAEYETWISPLNRQSMVCDRPFELYRTRKAVIGNDPFKTVAVPKEEIPLFGSPLETFQDSSGDKVVRILVREERGVGTQIVFSTKSGCFHEIPIVTIESLQTRISVDMVYTRLRAAVASSSQTNE